MPQHSSRHAHRAPKQYSVWPKVIGIIIGIIAVLAIVLGILGAQLYSQAKQVKAHEEKSALFTERRCRLHNRHFANLNHYQCTASRSGRNTAGHDRC